MWKIKLPHIVFGFLSLLALPFILSSGSVSASSYSMTVSESSLSGLTSYTSSDVGFSFTYVSFQFYGSGLSGRATGPCYYWNSALTASECPMIYFNNGDNITILTVRDSKVGIQPGYGWNFVDITFYDSDPFVSEPCPDCPPIPDNPYDDKLDSINRSILIVSATALVIYFFYAIYSMFFGGVR